MVNKGVMTLSENLMIFPSLNFIINKSNFRKRSLGCVLYEMIFLKLAFKYGQGGNPNVPELRKSGYFAAVLKK